MEYDCLKKTVQTNYAKWRAHCTINYLNRMNSDAAKAVKTEASIEELRILINDIF